MMQWLYKFFVTEQELVNALPMMLPKRNPEHLEQFVRFMRKRLFIRKVKKWL